MISPLTGVTATAIFPTTATNNLASTDQFYVNESGTNKYVTYGDLLTDLAGTNLVVENDGGNPDSLALNTTVTGLTSVTSTYVTASYTNTINYNGINGGISKTFAGSSSFSPSEGIIISVDSTVYPHHAIFVKYVLWNVAVPAAGSYANMRAGTIMTVINNEGTSFNIAESTTQDIGDTSTIDFTVNVSGTSTEIILNTSNQAFQVDSKFEYTLL
jgi:hypothetical protein